MIMSHEPLMETTPLRDHGKTIHCTQHAHMLSFHSASNDITWLAFAPVGLRFCHIDQITVVNPFTAVPPKSTMDYVPFKSNWKNSNGAILMKIKV